MQLDIEDILTHGIGRLLQTILFFGSAIWLGSLIGGVAILAVQGGFPDFRDFEELLLSPLLLLNMWMILNVAFLAAMMILILVKDGLDYVPWGIIMGGESLFVMLGWDLDFFKPVQAAISWACWLVLLGMAETGVWVIRQWRRQIQIQQIIELKADNWAARAEREARDSTASPEAELP